MNQDSSVNLENPKRSDLLSAVSDGKPHYRRCHHRYPHLHTTTGAHGDSQIWGHGILIVIIQDRRYELRSKL
jgi:hypothetical protein